MTGLLRINWSYCPGCAEGDHATHVAEYFDDDIPQPCACACAPHAHGPSHGSLPTVARSRPRPTGSAAHRTAKKMLCHECYRRTHFVDLCVKGCSDCAAEGLPVRMVPR